MQKISNIKPILLAGVLFIAPCFANAETIENPAFTDVTVSSDDGVMIVELTSPPINGISVNVIKGINAALDVVLADESFKSMVITGKKDLFSGGAGEITPGPNGLSHAEYAQQTFNRMERAPFPIVGALNGLVGQGGNKLAMATDLRVVGENLIVTQLEVQVGLIPGFGGMQRLSRIVGRPVALEMMLAGRPLNAQDAKDLGYAYAIAPIDETLEQAIALARKMSVELGPEALAVLKERFATSLNENFAEALTNDQVAFDAMFGTPAFQEAFRKFQERMSEQQ